MTSGKGMAKGKERERGVRKHLETGKDGTAKKRTGYWVEQNQWMKYQVSTNGAACLRELLSREQMEYITTPEVEFMNVQFSFVEGESYQT